MGVRFRKSTKLGGAKINLGAKSVGVSFGGKYGGISVNSRTGTRGRVSMPGTGLSYTKSLNSSKSRPGKTAASAGSSAAYSEFSSPSEIRAQQRNARLQKKSYRWLLLSFIGTLLVFIPVILHKEDTGLIGLMLLGMIWIIVCMISALVFYIKERRK